jgi:hypothetical protein
MRPEEEARRVVGEYIEAPLHAHCMRPKNRTALPGPERHVSNFLQSAAKPRRISS